MKKNRTFYFALIPSLLLLFIVVGIVIGVGVRKKSNSPSHFVLKSSCSSTLYPDLCYSTLATVPGVVEKLKTQNDVIEASLNQTILAVEVEFFNVQRLINRSEGLTAREKIALHDCLEMIDETLDELHSVSEDLKLYHKKHSLAYEMKILLSASMTNQESCLDGFSHESADRNLREKLLESFMRVYRMCSNSLAMIKNTTDADNDLGRLMNQERRLEEEERKFPSWLLPNDKRLLQEISVNPDVIVAADGSGNFRTISQAVAAAPDHSQKRYIIKIKAGVYKENVDITKKKTNLMFVGDGRKNTIITGNKNVKDGSTTFHSATVAVVGNGFLARDITFENTAGPSKHQAVALRVNADLSAFYRCDILGYQDTLYVHSLRQYYTDCFIAGTVDFIFGNAAVVFQNCDIHARKPDPGQKNMITAQGRDDPNQNTGISIQNCRIAATSDLQPVKNSFPTYLGRPWKEYSRTVIMQSTISDVIHPSGWFPWSGNFALNTLYYAEYQNTGAGSSTTNRVKWKGYKVITSATEAQQFTVSNFIKGSNWLPSIGFPFSLGL